jgi:hypothetical protein
VADHRQAEPQRGVRGHHGRDRFRVRALRRQDQDDAVRAGLADEAAGDLGGFLAVGLVFEQGVYLVEQGEQRVQPQVLAGGQVPVDLPALGDILDGQFRDEPLTALQLALQRPQRVGAAAQCSSSSPDT